MQPTAFGEYLLSDEVGFVRGWRMEMPAEHRAVGFRRPIWVYEKAKVAEVEVECGAGMMAVEKGAGMVAKEDGTTMVANKAEKKESSE